MLEVFDRQIADVDCQIASRISQDDDSVAEDTSAPAAQSIEALSSSPVLSTATEELPHPEVKRQGLPGFASSIRRLDAIPGVNQRIAQMVLAEVGVDMSRFLK